MSVVELQVSIRPNSHHCLLGADWIAAVQPTFTYRKKKVNKVKKTKQAGAREDEHIDEAEPSDDKSSASTDSPSHENFHYSSSSSIRCPSHSSLSFSQTYESLNNKHSQLDRRKDRQTDERSSHSRERQNSRKNSIRKHLDSL